MCFLAICMSYLEKNVYLDLPVFLLSFVFLISSYISCLCILEINPLLVTLFANILSHSVDCLFVLFIVFFAAQKL